MAIRVTCQPAPVQVVSVALQVASSATATTFCGVLVELYRVAVLVIPNNRVLQIYDLRCASDGRTGSGSYAIIEECTVVNFHVAVRIGYVDVYRTGVVDRLVVAHDRIADVEVIYRHGVVGIPDRDRRRAADRCVRGRARAMDLRIGDQHAVPTDPNGMPEPVFEGEPDDGGGTGDADAGAVTVRLMLAVKHRGLGGRGGDDQHVLNQRKADILRTGVG